MMMKRPLIVGMGGTTRPGSSSEQSLAIALHKAQQSGAETMLFRGADLMLPLYEPQSKVLAPDAKALIDALRRADGVIFSSPCYHGGVSGLLKNAIDYTEEMSADERVYLDGRAVGAICCGFGVQGPMAGLNALRAITHALRGWPVPLGVAINSAAVKFRDCGCDDEKTVQQIEAMADQVLNFAVMSLQERTKARARSSLECNTSLV
ncbi:FMN reductase [Paraburkholderia sp. UCT70]|uniref:NADPH-dependent FMN reductase n=1 Tax=Paraburkholderia sp. UCT70 TaxID=2991068 RepID=UPI003D1E81D5